MLWYDVMFLAEYFWQYLSIVIIHHYGLAFCSSKTNLSSMQMKELSDLDSWKSHISVQLDHVLRDNAVLR